jgi:hypothetical protein
MIDSGVQGKRGSTFNCNDMIATFMIRSRRLQTILNNFEVLDGSKYKKRYMLWI